MDPNPALCRDCLTAWRRPRPLPGLPLPAHARPCRAQHPLHRASRLRRLLRLGREARRPQPARPPVIVGGGKRGVVTTACYIARIKGVRSAMPMFKALKLCPEAVVVRPRMARYVEVSRAIRGHDARAHPAGRAALARRGLPRPLRHRAPAPRPAGGPARPPAGRASSASSASPPRSASPTTSSSPRSPPTSTSPAASASSAAPRPRASSLPSPVSVIWGVGQAAVAALEREGIRTIADLRARTARRSIRRFGSLGDRLWHLSHGDDTRPRPPRQRA